MNIHTQKGMTLIEVLVAMAVLAMVAGAVLTMTGQSTRLIISSEEKAIARILADNEMIEMIARPHAIEESITTESVEFANRRWSVRRSVVSPDVENIYRIEITVALNEQSQVLARAVTLTEAP